ncbi:MULTISPECIES: hypothetical protein [unclassified Pseudomonas]|uniref:hypothetical protein n=1 Tax=unclassified Pseudomonas TaxID=196821 RepID=UPI00244B13E0|nr:MULTISPECIES: hypothetical protein [unclassified Pseudomonas]MDG9926302.1 hypothetical protein [Pseudomonas sp. GD04045]MDH0034192.1 hypothetical protein [Pseudomonas sp. GD04019]
MRGRNKAVTGIGDCSCSASVPPVDDTPAGYDPLGVPAVSPPLINFCANAFTSKPAECRSPAKPRARAAA